MRPSISVETLFCVMCASPKGASFVAFVDLNLVSLPVKPSQVLCLQQATRRPCTHCCSIFAWIPGQIFICNSVTGSKAKGHLLQCFYLLRDAFHEKKQTKTSAIAAKPHFVTFVCLGSMYDLFLPLVAFIPLKMYSFLHLWVAVTHEQSNANSTWFSAKTTFMDTLEQQFVVYCLCYSVARCLYLLISPGLISYCIVNFDLWQSLSKNSNTNRRYSRWRTDEWHLQQTYTSTHESWPTRRKRHKYDSFDRSHWPSPRLGLNGTGPRTRPLIQLWLMRSINYLIVIGLSCRGNNVPIISTMPAATPRSLIRQFDRYCTDW